MRSNAWATRALLWYAAIILLAGFAERDVYIAVAGGIFVCLAFISYNRLMFSENLRLFYVFFILSVLLFFAFVYFNSPHGSLLNRDILYFLNLFLSVALVVPATRYADVKFSRGQLRFLLLCLLLGIVVTLATSSLIRPHLTAYHGLAFLLLGGPLFLRNSPWQWAFLGVYALISVALGQSQNLVFLAAWGMFFCLTFILSFRQIGAVAVVGMLTLPVVIALLFSAGKFENVQDFDTKVRAYFTYTTFERLAANPAEMRFGEAIIPFELGAIGRSAFRGSVASISDIGAHNFVTTIVAKMGLLGVPVAAGLLIVCFSGFGRGARRVPPAHRLLYSYTVAFVFISLSVNEAVLSFIYEPVLLLPAFYSILTRSGNESAGVPRAA